MTEGGPSTNGGVAAARIAFELATAPLATNFEKGRALEEFSRTLFSTIPGIEVHASNSVDVFSCQELDVVLANMGDSDGLFGFDLTLLVECKNWQAPVGSMEVAWFDTKLRMRGLRTGLLIALNGITGNPHSLTSAHAIVAAALAENRRIGVVKPEDLLAAGTGPDLARFCRRRLAELHLSRGLAL